MQKRYCMKRKLGTLYSIFWNICMHRLDQFAWESSNIGQLTWMKPSKRENAAKSKNLTKTQPASYWKSKWSFFALDDWSSGSLTRHLSFPLLYIFFCLKLLGNALACISLFSRSFTIVFNYKPNQAHCIIWGSWSWIRVRQTYADGTAER